MTLAHVDKYMPEGVRALANLMNMLPEAAAACKVPFNRKGSAWGYMGLNLEGRKYWIGVNFSEPGKLVFATRCQVDPQGAAKLGWIPYPEGWWDGIELDSEAVHFFSRSKVSQMEWLGHFLRSHLAQARSIQTPDQPPIPEEPEEAS